MEELIGQLVQQFDSVLLDSPSLLAVTDAAVLAPLVEEVVLVVGRAQARPETIQAARQQLALVHSQPVRLVVNRAEVDHRSAYYHHKAT
jgi:Mrp family chromosome partitioning ATPase